MGNTTKRIALATLMALIVSGAAIAHPDRTEKNGMSQELVLKNFERSLQMGDFPGVVESTIYNVVLYKNRYPQLDYAQLASSLQRIAEDNQDASLSYKAELAFLYLSNSATIDLTPESATSNHGYIFKQISERLADKFLAVHE